MNAPVLNGKFQYGNMVTPESRKAVIAEKLGKRIN